VTRIWIKVKRFRLLGKGGRDEKGLYEGNYEGKFETVTYVERKRSCDITTDMANADFDDSGNENVGECLSIMEE
jgi:hypothetical protein